MTPDVNVQIMNFPVPGSELVVPNEDGSFTIMINARLSYEDQMKAYAHAMRHITEDDFQKENVQEIEAHAHEMVRAAKSARKIPAKQFEAQLRRLSKRTPTASAGSSKKRTGNQISSRNRGYK